MVNDRNNRHRKPCRTNKLRPKFHFPFTNGIMRWMLSKSVDSKFNHYMCNFRFILFNYIAFSKHSRRNVAQMWMAKVYEAVTCPSRWIMRWNIVKSVLRGLSFWTIVLHLIVRAATSRFEEVHSPGRCSPRFAIRSSNNSWRSRDLRDNGS